MRGEVEGDHRRRTRVVCRRSDCRVCTAAPLRSARKYRVGVAHILAPLANAGAPVSIEGDARNYIGTDDRGIELEMTLVPDNRRDGGHAVIHAMPTKCRK